MHVDPEHPKHAQWVTCLAIMQAMEELGHFPYCVQILATWGLKHEAMMADERHDNGPQDLITVSLCFQIAIDKMQLCSLCLPIP